MDIEHGGKRMCRGRGQSRGRGRTRCGVPVRGGCSASPKRKVPAQQKEKQTGSEENPIEVDKMAEVAMETKDAGKDTDSLETEEITSRTEQIVLADQDADCTVKEAEDQTQEPKRMVCFQLMSHTVYNLIVAFYWILKMYRI